MFKDNYDDILYFCYCQKENPTKKTKQNKTKNELILLTIFWNNPFFCATELHHCQKLKQVVKICKIKSLQNSRPILHSAFFSLRSGPRRAVRTLLHTSVYSRVPRKTTAVPNQCQAVKGFWKYMMEKMRLRNFLSVTTRVTVSEAHSVVRMKTPRMQTYLKKLVKAANKALRKWFVMERGIFIWRPSYGNKKQYVFPSLIIKYITVFSLVWEI